MDNPRPEKVAVVEEVRGRLDSSAATVLTEYRGLTVSEMAELRRALQSAGGEYKVYKNTLVKLAIAGGRHETLDELLSGPTGIAFVSGEITAVAKALRDYARTNPSLVVKGGLLGDGFLSAQDLARLADLPSREVLLSGLAGALAAPMQQFAGLLQALPRNLAYGLSALVEKQGGTVGGEEPGETEAAVVAEAAPTTDAAGPAPTTETAEPGPTTETAEPAEPAETEEAAASTEAQDQTETSPDQEENNQDG